MRGGMWLALGLAACSGSSTLGADAAGPDAGTGPPASAGHALVFADDLEKVLLVNAGLGGNSLPPVTAPTRVWGWDGTSWELLDSSGPSVRNIGGVAYDSDRRRLVLYGGSYDLPHIYGDTWEWSPDAGWHELSGAGPGPRDHTQMAYDRKRRRIVLFGGSGTDLQALGDTWEHDGASWQRVATTGPPARVHHGLAYDPGLERVVLFAGIHPPSQDLGDSWAWDGATWTSLAADVAPRTHACMTYDGRLGALVVLGGAAATSGLDMLRHDQGSWVPFSAPPEPASRYLPAAAFDARRQALVLFGGGANTGSALLADTWELDAGGWHRK